MTELDYKFIMGYLYDEQVTMKEISDAVTDPVAHTMINGKTYSLDQAGINSYNRYKDSILAQTYYLSKAAKVPYALMYDAIIAPIQEGKPVDSAFLDDIFIRSLFDTDIHAAVCSCIDYDRRIFENVEPLYNSFGKEICPGDLVSLANTAEIFQYRDSYYIHISDSNCQRHMLRREQIDAATRVMKSKIVCRTYDQGDIYDALVVDIAVNHRNSLVSVYDTFGKIAENLGIGEKISIENCVKQFNKEVNRSAVTRTIIG